MTPKKVLVVDDSELVHKMHVLTFRQYPGCELFHAYQGVEAFDILNAHPDVDLILLDVNMPVMDGLAFLEARRGMGIFLEIPVILISTERTEEDIRRGIEAGATAYLSKPFKPPELRALIDGLEGVISGPA
jgi:two-component system, chemotaxis family, chemotaxis protein CheY